ncbi:uncharacterized [Tachysurus ichikawai]
MADQHEAGEEREMEAEEMITEEEALLHFGRYTEARDCLPWEQRTFKEKLMHHLDRIFLVFLAVFFLIVVSEALYKIWYVTNWRQVLEYLLDSVSFFFMQEDEEELLEL